METVDLKQARAFDEHKLRKVPLFDSPHLYFDLYCVLPGQSQRVHSHEGSDKVYVVLEGDGTFDIAGEQKRLGPGTSVIAPAGVPHGVRNDTDADLVLLVTMAPKPG